MSGLNYIHIMGFKTAACLDGDNAKHIDSVSETDDWERSVQNIIEENKPSYFHITVESDDGKPLPPFNQ